MSFKQLSQHVRDFHNDEEGDAIQVVLIVAMAAIVMLGVTKFTNDKLWTDAIKKIGDLLKITMKAG